jgi:hypothetical protein
MAARLVRLSRDRSRTRRARHRISRCVSTRAGVLPRHLSDECRSRQPEKQRSATTTRLRAGPRRTHEHAAREQRDGVRIGHVLCASRRARPCSSGHTSHWRISTMRMTRPARPLQTSGHFQLIRASLTTAAWRPARRDPTLATHITKRGLLRAHRSFSFKADATLAARAAEVRALDDASATSTDTRTIRPPFARDVFAKRVKPRAARTHWSGCAHHCRFFCDS